jgi:hypothetical protein
MPLRVDNIDLGELLGLRTVPVATGYTTGIYLSGVFIAKYGNVVGSPVLKKDCRCHPTSVIRGFVSHFPNNHTNINLE